MLKSIKQAFKVPLVFHWSALILLALFLLSYGFMYGLIYYLVIIGSTILHEYGHVWAAQRCNASVKKVVIMALGAGALIASDAFIGKPKNELKCAIAGPFISLLLFLKFSIIWFILSLLEVQSPIIEYTCIINMAMFLFNLLPIYPMDGGRILNSLLTYVFSRKRGSFEGGILSIKVSSIIAYILSSFLLLSCVFVGWYWMAFMFICIIVFTYINKEGAIIQYNKYYFPSASNH